VNTTKTHDAHVLANMDKVLTTYRSRMAAIEATNPARLTYVLSWGDGRFVRIDEQSRPVVTGFEHATLFGDRVAAMTWVKNGLTDGARVAPHAVLAFNAKQDAAIQLQRVIDMVEAQRNEAAAH
jgi:hypothetical protein